MHGNLEPEENVFLDNEKEEEIEWDIEDMKKSYKEGAKDYDRIIKQMQDETEENDK